MLFDKIFGRLTGPKARSLPDYIETGGDQSVRQPYEIKNVDFFSFVLNSERDVLQALIDRQLNIPARGKTNYTVLFDRVFLIFSRLNRLQGADKNLGTISEIDVGFWIPVVATSPLRLLWYQPYLFVDSGYAVASGREIYGFKKSLGTFAIPSLDEVAREFWVETIVSHGPNTDAGNERVISVTLNGDDDRKEETLYQDFGDAVAKVLGAVTGQNADADNSFTVPGLGVMVDLLAELSRPKVPMVFLNNFGTLPDGAKACYQAVTEAPAVLTHFHKGGLMAGAYSLDLKQFYNYPMADDLGLQKGSQPVDLAVWMNFDFNMENGREIWRAP